MHKYVIFGASYFAEMLAYYVEKYDDVDVLAYTVDRKYIDKSEIYGKPLVAFEDLDKLYDMSNVYVLIALGYKNMNDIRKAKYLEAKSKGYKIAGFVHPEAYIEKCDMGEGNIILERVNIGHGVRLGNCNILWNSAVIQHDCDISDFNFIAGGSVFGGKVTVRDNCFFGLNCTIRSAITVENYTLAGAGCYVSKSTESNCVYVPERTKMLEGKISKDFM